MKVIRAEAMGFCFGVRDALAVAEAIDDPSNVTVHGELVHNRRVLVQLERRGFQSTPEESRGSSVPATPRVLVTAHGISDQERNRLIGAGKTLIDTTCPLVQRVHRAARALAAEGRHLLIVGREDHVEVRGIVEDLESFDVVPNAGEVRTYPHQRLGVVCQTTAPPRLVEEIRLAIRKQNPRADIRFVDTVCQPTIERQQAVERLCRTVDAMVVVGGRTSNNTHQLVELARERGVTAYHVESADDLNPAWFACCRAVGLTAGTSTLDETIDEVYRALCSMQQPEIVQRESTP